MSWSSSSDGACVRRCDFQLLLDAGKAETEFVGLASSRQSEWGALVFELLAYVAGGEMEVKVAVPLIGAALEHRRKGKTFSDESMKTAKEAVADAMWCHDVQLGAAKLVAERARLSEAVQLLEGSGAVEASIFKRLLDEEMLEASGLVSGATFLKRMKRMNTDQIYRQRKYNLLHEESEGYAKVFTLLAQLGLKKKQGSSELKAAKKTLKRLIGGFDLDPNRVFDLTLDALESRLAASNDEDSDDEDEEEQDDEAHVALIGEFARSSLPHVLGFKFQHRRGESTPKSLCRVAALLVSKGLLDLDLLLPHLWPSPAEMAKDQIAAAEKSRAAAKAFGVVSLANDEPPPVKSGVGSKQQLAVVARPQEDPATVFAQVDDEESRSDQMGAIAEALILDGRWSSAETLLVQLERAGAVPCAVAATRVALCELAHALLEPIYGGLISPRRLGMTQCDEFTPPVLAVRLGGDGRLEAPRTLSALLALLEPVLCHVHVYVSADPLLLTKLCRLAKSVFTSAGTTEDVREAMMRILRSCVLPSVSLLGPMPAIAFELWSALSLLNYSERHDLYAAWRGRGLERHGVGLKHHELSLAECKAGSGVRSALKRVANEKKNSKHVGRLLAKLAHSNPLVVFDVILSTIEAYDNMIQPIVESLGFMSPLALDVLAYLIPVHLEDTKSREKLQKDGINIAHWFQYLATFAAVFYRAHPLTELTGLLQYVVERLKYGDALELLVFNELLARMGGCDVLEDISDAQLEGLSGGDLLRRELLAFAKPSKRAVTRLQEALCTPRFALPILALIAQQRVHALYKSTALDHVKLLGQLYDKTQLVLVQLVDFISRHAAYKTLLPSFDELVVDLRMEPQVAMLSARPLIQAAATERRALAKAAVKKDDAKEEEVVPAALSPWDTKSEGMIVALKRAVEVKWDAMTPDLYLTFWSLSLSDIRLPTKTYNSQMQLLRSRADTGARDSDEKKRKEATRCSNLAEALAAELKQQQAHHLAVTVELEKAKATLLGAVSEDHRRGISEAILQHCVMPRLMLTPEDALYCAAFFHTLHEMKTPNFSSLQYYDRVVKDVFPTIYAATDREARCLGVFLKATFGPLRTWRASKEAYDRDAASKPGFSTAIGSANRCTYEQYCTVFFRWYDKMTKVALHCLENYKQHGRACLLVLIKLVGVYPARKRVYESITEKLAVLKAQDEFKDVQAMAQRYSQLLEQRKSTFIDQPIVVVTAAAAVTAPKVAAASTTKVATTGAALVRSTSGSSSKTAVGIAKSSPETTTSEAPAKTKVSSAKTLVTTTKPAATEEKKSTPKDKKVEAPPSKSTAAASSSSKKSPTTAPTTTTTTTAASDKAASRSERFAVKADPVKPAAAAAAKVSSKAAPAKQTSSSSSKEKKEERSSSKDAKKKEDTSKTALSSSSRSSPPSSRLTAAAAAAKKETSTSSSKKDSPPASSAAEPFSRRTATTTTAAATTSSRGARGSEEPRGERSSRSNDSTRRAAPAQKRGRDEHSRDGDRPKDGDRLKQPRGTSEPAKKQPVVAAATESSKSGFTDGNRRKRDREDADSPRETGGPSRRGRQPR